MSQDRTELERAQRGDRGAFFALYEGHAAACWRLGVATGRDLDVAQSAVIHAFARVLGPAHGHDPSRFLPVSTQLLRATRETAIDQAPAEGTDMPYVADGAARAFDRLPEGWRSVLWLRHAEHLDLAATGAVLGLTVPDTEQLGDRGLAGFREQLAKVHHPDATTSECQGTILRLGGYVAGGIPEPEAGRVRRHLDKCEECRARLDEVDDLTTRLRHFVPDLPLVIEALAAEEWLARVNERSGPLGLRLPGGQLVPAWVERSLAGATAAVVSLGITAAVMLAARGGGNGNPLDVPAAPVAQRQVLNGDATGIDVDAGSLPIATSPTGGLSTADGTFGGTAGTDAPPASSLPAPPPTPTPAAEAPRGAPAPAQGPSAAPEPAPAPTPPPNPPATSPASPIPVVEDITEALDPVVEDLCESLSVCLPAGTDSVLPQIPGL